MINLEATLDVTLKDGQDERDFKLKLGQEEIVNLFHHLYYGSRVWENTFWHGHHILKCPLDMWIYQEILWELKPDFIIETGTFMGGSTLYYAHLLDLQNHGKIITIDVSSPPNLPTHPRITYIEGSSTDPTIFNKVMEIIGKGKNILVVLDSDHSLGHVIEEMRLWHPVVSQGSYMIVEDTNVNGHPVRSDFGPGPMEAVNLFLNENTDFQIDLQRQKFFMTQNPRGYLKKV